MDKAAWARGDLANGLEAFQYPRPVLTPIGVAETREQIEALLPWPIRLTDLFR